VLLIMDDLQWFDRASGMTLGFVARRLGGSRVAFLATARTGSFEGAGIPSRELRPLTDEPAAALLRTAYPALAAEARRWILTAAQGNPLALHEMAVDRSAGTKGATRIADLFADRVRDLPGETRRLLLMAALDGTGDLRLLRAADGPSGLEALTAAEQARLIEMSGGNARLRFLHPLGQAAVVRMSGLPTTRCSRPSSRCCWSAGSAVDRRCGRRSTRRSIIGPARSQTICCRWLAPMPTRHGSLRPCSPTWMPRSPGWGRGRRAAGAHDRVGLHLHRSAGGLPGGVAAGAGREP
jgi:hypothetical protein